jgi:hypothetical protein
MDGRHVSVEDRRWRCAEDGLGYSSGRHTAPLRMRQPPNLRARRINVIAIIAEVDIS